MSQAQVERYLQAHPGDHHHTEIAKALGLSDTTVYDQLSFLKNRWHVVKSREAPEWPTKCKFKVVWRLCD